MIYFADCGIIQAVPQRNIGAVTELVSHKLLTKRNIGRIHMKRDSGYNTKQKEKLLDYLIKNKEKHTNVQEISAFLNAEGTPVGVATIYRQLDKLVDKGIVRKYAFDGKTCACYQYIDSERGCHNHFHLKCLSCGRLIHLDCDHLAEISNHIAKEHGFQIDSSQTVFYGICSDCSKKKQE